MKKAMIGPMGHWMTKIDTRGADHIAGALAGHDGNFPPGAAGQTAVNASIEAA